MACPLHTLSSIELLAGFAALVKKAGLQHCVVFVDGVDEFPAMAEDANSMITFLRPLLGTMALIECPGMAFKFFLPRELETLLRNRKWFRTDRVHISPIIWREQEILALLGQRLVHFSDRRPPYEQLGQLCDVDLAQVIGDEVVNLAHGSPRAALMLASMLLKSHYERPEPPEMIVMDTWKDVKREWQAYQEAWGMVPRATLVPSATEPRHYVLAVDEEKGLVWLGGSEIRSKFTPQDYSVLLCLYRHKAEVCTKDVIAQEAWSVAESEGVSDQAIAACIARLRDVFREVAPHTGYIETIRSKKREQGGYRLHPEGF
ncbi:MAG: winged helix-turn-helix transcriptional regulator [Anaerolineales bacterium]|nr:winged helix-turn-helix transcriptional regulator [Anaerolineales bacterium]